MSNILKNELGNKYGLLTVIERDLNTKEGRAVWICQCDCGSKVSVLGKHLRSGNTKSCGCLQKQKAIQSNLNRGGSLVGKRFGKLTVIEEAGFITGVNEKRRRLYLCKCDCGNLCKVQHQYLSYGDTSSCGCIRSKGEAQIEQILSQNNICYKKEFSFNDLMDKEKLRFDFAIFNKDKLFMLIEFQGEQHTNPNNGYYSEDLIIHDKMKEDFCKKNKIPLIKIFYKRNQIINIKDLHLEELKNEPV